MKIKKKSLRKHQRSILTLCLLMFGVIFIYPQSNKPFKVVFVANTIYLCNHEDWIDKVKSNWGATGICININWGDFSVSPNHIDFTNIDKAINSVSRRKDLDIYIRVSMGAFKPEWVKPGSEGLKTEDFQITKTKELYDHYKYNKETDSVRAKHPLNLASQLSLSYMLNFYSAVLNHLSNFSDSTKLKIKEIVPTISPDGEMEYPNEEMCGYSPPENDKFISYLLSKYQSIENLNNNWGTDFNNFDTISINPTNYNWDVDISYADAATKNILPGRLDWINFKTTLLKSFIDDCASITHNMGFKIGLQIGSIYDDVIIRRG